MSTQPEALRMADQLDRGWAYKDECSEIAAELRRLHELALEQQGKIYALEMARSMEQKTAKLKQDALLGALEEIHQATMKNKVVIAKYIGINFLAAIAIRKAKEGEEGEEGKCL